LGIYSSVQNTDDVHDDDVR